MGYDKQNSWNLANFALIRSNNEETGLSFISTHYSDVIMGAMASQITSLTIVYSTVYSSADHRKHQSSASLAFVQGIHRWPVNSPHKWPVTREMFPFDDVIISCLFNWGMKIDSNFAYNIFKFIQLKQKICVRRRVYTRGSISQWSSKCQSMAWLRYLNQYCSSSSIQESLGFRVLTALKRYTCNIILLGACFRIR